MKESSVSHTVHSGGTCFHTLATVPSLGQDPAKASRTTLSRLAEAHPGHTARPRPRTCSLTCAALGSRGHLSSRVPGEQQALLKV